MAVNSGKYYSDTKQGNCYNVTTAAAGTTFPLSSGTAMTFGVWNTTDSLNVVLQTLNVGFTSGTIALGEVGLTIINAGAVIATPISAFTDGIFGTTIHNNLFGGGSPRARATPSAATVAASTAKWWTGASFPVAAVVSQMHMNLDFDGRVILGPGFAAFVTGSIAQTALFSMTLSWQEVPV